MRARRFIAVMATASTMTCTGLGLGALLPGTALSATPAAAATSEEAGFLARANQTRASVGAQPLSLDAPISGVARSWAQTMAAQGGISHNPDIGSQISGWSKLGENVGVGSSVDQIHNALLASPSHYAAMTNPAYSLVGIGVASGGGRLYVVENFAEPAAGVRETVVAEPEPEPAPVARQVTTTTPPAPPPPPPPPPAPVVSPPPPRPAPSVSTFGFVLNVLRALDSSHNHD